MVAFVQNNKRFHHSIVNFYLAEVDLVHFVSFQRIFVRKLVLKAEFYFHLVTNRADIDVHSDFLVTREFSIVASDFDFVIDGTRASSFEDYFERVFLTALESES